MQGMFTLSVGRMNSILGRNTIFLSISYGLDTCDAERENIDISCMRTFYESLFSVKRRLMVHLILEAIHGLNCMILTLTFRMDQGQM